MNRIKDLLTRKVLGLPVWVLVGAVVALIVGRTVLSRGADLVAETETGGDVESVDIPRLVAPSGAGVNLPGSSTGASVEETNDAWRRRAVEWLVSTGAGTDAATAAIDKYLSGQQLSAPEAALRDRVVSQFGLPPDLPSAPEDLTVRPFKTVTVQAKQVSVASLLRKYSMTGDEFRKLNAGLYAGKPAGYQVGALKKGQVVSLYTDKQGGRSS